MDQDIISQLAPGGRLRAGINLGNMLLVTGAAAGGDPIGVAPDMARAIADRLGVAVSYVTYPSPGEVADGLAGGAWNIALIADEPARAESIAFSAAYVEVEATYLVAENAPFASVEEVDRPGVRIATSARSAYDLYLSRSLKHAELLRAKGMAGAAELFTTRKLDALAGLRPALAVKALELPGTRVMDGAYTTIQQAIGCDPAHTAAAQFIEQFVAEAKASGLIARLIERHGVKGRLRVASG